MPRGAKVVIAVGVLALVGIGLYLLSESPETLESLDPTGTLQAKRRFDRVNERIDDFMPKDRGVYVRPPPPPPDGQTIVVTLTRLDADDPVHAHTRIEVDGKDVFLLPKGDFDDSRPDLIEKRLAEYDAIFEKVGEALAAAWKRRGNDPEVKGRIRTPGPQVLKLLSADVIRVLEAFMKVGIIGITFEGAPSPMPRARGGSPIQPDER